MRAIAVGTNIFDSVMDSDGNLQFEAEKFNQHIASDEKILKKVAITSPQGLELVFSRCNDRLIEFMKVLSLTHECVREKASDGTLFYRGPSPDEVQLVEFAKDMGFVFEGEEGGHFLLRVGEE